MQERNSEGARDDSEPFPFSRSLPSPVKIEPAGASSAESSAPPANVLSDAILPNAGGESPAEWKLHAALQQADTLQIKKQIAELQQNVKAAIETGQAALELTQEEAEKLRRELHALRSAMSEARKDAEEAQKNADEQRARTQDLRSGWQSAALQLRLQFVRDLLHDGHEAQKPIKEAIALEELRRAGGMEAWIEKYPAQFADSMTRIYLPAEFGNSAAEGLALQTLDEARAALELSIKALGLEWICPPQGAPLTADYEITGAEAGSGASNTVARVARRGFRLRGKQYLAAQVARFAAPPQTKEASELSGAAVYSPALQSPAYSAALQAALSDVSSETLEARLEIRAAPDNLEKSYSAENAPITSKLTLEAAPPVAEVEPEWYQSVQRKRINCAELPALRVLEALGRLYNPLDAAPENALQTLLYSLLPLFGTRANLSQFNLPPEWEEFLIELRPSLDKWLKTTLDIGIVAPANTTPFDPVLMEAVETRATAHPQTYGTVAKLEQAGVTYRGHPLFRAKVVRYESGENG